MCSEFVIVFQVEMLYQRYFLRMNQSNMTHVLVLLACLVFALGLLLILMLTLRSEPFLTLLQSPENLSLAIILIGCIVVYGGKTPLYRGLTLEDILKEKYLLFATTIAQNYIEIIMIRNVILVSSVTTRIVL